MIQHNAPLVGRKEHFVSMKVTSLMSDLLKHGMLTGMSLQVCVKAMDLPVSQMTARFFYQALEWMKMNHLFT